MSVSIRKYSTLLRICHAHLSPSERDSKEGVQYGEDFFDEGGLGARSHDRAVRTYISRAVFFSRAIVSVLEWPSKKRAIYSYFALRCWSFRARTCFFAAFVHSGLPTMPVCQPTMPALYRTPALFGIVPILLVLVIANFSEPSDFTGTILAVGTVQPALQGDPCCMGRQCAPSRGYSVTWCPLCSARFC